MFMTFLRFSPQLVAMKLRLYPNWLAKQRVFSHLFRGMSLEEFNRHCRDFAASDGHLIRPRARTFLHSLLAGGNRVVVISASVENWVRPFFEAMDDGKNIAFLCTQVETRDGLLTGRFLTANCYGPEKVNRLRAILSAPRERYFIIAYGDSRGDRELLSYADEGHYKPFRR